MAVLAKEEEMIEMSGKEEWVHKFWYGYAMNSAVKINNKELHIST